MGGGVYRGGRCLGSWWGGKGFLGGQEQDRMVRFEEDVTEFGMKFVGCEDSA